MSWDAYPDPGEQPGDQPPDPKRYFPHTVAKFDSRCSDCSWDLEEGLDLVFKVDGDWLCEECAERMAGLS